MFMFWFNSFKSFLELSLLSFFISIFPISLIEAILVLILSFCSLFLFGLNFKKNLKENDIYSIPLFLKIKY